MELEIKGLHTRQEEIVRGIIDSDAKFHILKSSRQFGKTTLLSYLATILALIEKKEDILIVSPTYSQTEVLFNKIINLDNISKVIRNSKISKPYEIVFITGTKIVFKSGERPDSLRGGSYKYVLIDEFSFVKEGLFDTILRPTTAAKPNSKIIISSTPRGYDQFFDLWNMSVEHKDANYKHYSAHYSDNPYYDLKEVEDAKLRLPPNIFRQEYEAEFISSGGDVFTDLLQVMTMDATMAPVSNQMYFAGIDFGRADDATVLTILDKDRHVVFCKPFSGTWTKQINDLGLILNQYKPITYAEKNGIGDPVIDQLTKEYANIRSFITSNSSKKMLVEALRMTIMKQEIALPTREYNNDLFMELSDYTYSLTKTGLITYHHRAGKHDDFPDSLMLANHSYEKHNTTFKGLQFRRSSNMHA